MTINSYWYKKNAESYSDANCQALHGAVSWSLWLPLFLYFCAPILLIQMQAETEWNHIREKEWRSLQGMRDIYF